MRTFDLTPFYRSTVGFDRLFSLLDQSASESSPGYPPYNIERTGENNFRISVAVSGFSQNEISIVAKENTLTIKGEKAACIISFKTAGVSAPPARPPFTNGKGDVHCASQSGDSRDGLVLSQQGPQRLWRPAPGKQLFGHDSVAYLVEAPSDVQAGK